MSGWVAKRFWKTAQVVEVVGGWTVRLDARAVKTPAKADLVVPVRALAAAIAAEWNAQPERIDPLTMPFTRAANAAIDKVAPQLAEVVALTAAYGGTDHLCYRAERPAELIRRQVEGWDPVLAWAGDVLGAPLRTATGVAHCDQPAASLERHTAWVAALTPHELTALHELVSLSGSLVLGIAVCEGRLAPDAAWRLSRIDEDFQTEQWGADELAAEAAAIKREAFLQAHRLWSLLRGS